MILVLLVVPSLRLFEIRDLYDVAVFILTGENLGSYDISITCKQREKFRLLKGIVFVGGNEFLPNESTPCCEFVLMSFFVWGPSHPVFFDYGVVNVVVFDVELVLLL